MMKIDRIKYLRNCRIFRDFSWPSDLGSFERFNLIYGWNGSGKTTLSTMFLGLERGENLLSGECTLLMDGQAQDFTHPISKFPNIRVFNKDTVSRAVFEVPGTQLAPVYVIGEESVDKTKQVEDLKILLNQQRADAATTTKALASAENAFEGFCADRARDIKNLLTAPGGGIYNNFDKSGFKEAVRRIQRLDVIPQPLPDGTRAALLNQKDSKPKAILPPILQDYPILSDLTKVVDEALKKSVTSAAIQELADNTTLAKWINEGLALHRDSTTTCKFCGQALSKDRIRHLEAHFNDEFNRFQTELTGLLKRIQKIHGEIEALNPPAKEQIYDHLAMDYEKYRTSFMEKRKSVLTYLDKMYQAVEVKKEKPFQVVELSTVIAPAAAHICSVQPTGASTLEPKHSKESHSSCNSTTSIRKTSKSRLGKLERIWNQTR